MAETFKRRWVTVPKILSVCWLTKTFLRRIPFINSVEISERQFEVHSQEGGRMQVIMRTIIELIKRTVGGEVLRSRSNLHAARRHSTAPQCTPPSDEYTFSDLLNAFSVHSHFYSCKNYVNFNTRLFRDKTLTVYKVGTVTFLIS